jgi:hypothetical protein
MTLGRSLLWFIIGVRLGLLRLRHRLRRMTHRGTALLSGMTKMLTQPHHNRSYLWKLSL